MSQATIALRRKRLGRPERSLILVGLRGVGKTVLLNRIDEIARAEGFRSALLEVGEDKSLPQVIVPVLRSILYDLDRLEGLSEAVKRGFRVLRSFVGRVSLSMGEVDLGLGVDPEIGTADSGDLDTDLSELMLAIGEAAASRKTAIAIIMDELQYLHEEEFAALITAIHRVSQRNLPILLIGAGLPPVLGLAGRAKSYAERLFSFPPVGPLAANEAHDAVLRPAQREGVEFTLEALQSIYQITQGYPYFVQEWAYQAWNLAEASPITAENIDRATDAAIRNLDQSFFRVRFDRLNNSEKNYLHAMAILGAGPHRSSEIAKIYGVKPTSAGPIRATLIRKGMIYSPAHGDADFTVPLFNEFMHRVMPDWI